MAPEPDQSEATAKSEPNDAAFQWPPGSPPAPAPEVELPLAFLPQIPASEPQAVEPAGRGPSWAPGDRPPRLCSALGEIERAWLGVTASPLADLAGEPKGIETAIEVCARCGKSVGRFESDSSGCSLCRARRLPWERVVRLGVYEGSLRDAIHAFKFGPWRAIGTELGRRLGRSLRGRLETEGLDPTSALVVPVPTTFRRRMDRGIDHSLVLGRAVRAELGCGLARPVWRSHRPSQLEVAPSQRSANVARAFRPGPAWQRLLGLSGDLVRARPIVVVDDVMTSGATMRAACRAIGVARGRRAGGKGGPGSPQRTIADKPWVAVVGVAPAPGEPRRRGTADNAPTISASPPNHAGVRPEGREKSDRTR